MGFQSAGFRFVSRVAVAAMCAASFLLANPVQADHVSLSNDAGVQYRIDPSAGEISGATFPALSDSCNSSCLRLQIDGANFDSDTFNSSRDLDGRETVSDPGMFSGLTVVRKVYVPQSLNWLRSLTFLQNETAGDITVTISLEQYLRVPSSIEVLATSSGDAITDTADLWMTVTGDTAGTGTPPTGPLAFAWGDAGGDAIDAIGDPTVTNPHNLDWQNVTVPAGETYIYLAFMAVEADAAAALTAAQDLAALADLEQFDGLGSAELAQIQNWAFTDTDGDGMPDFFETNFGLDPNDAGDAALDADSDGLTNLGEWQNLTDPTDADSDADGLSDGDEVNTHGTDPRDADTDGDDISDGGEVAVGLDPLDPADGLALSNISDGVENSFQPRAANDAAGNTHLVWTQDAVGNGDRDDYEIYYKLLDPDGAVLIDQTRLTDDTGTPIVDTRPFVVVDGGTPFVGWQRDSSVAVAINLVMLDPSTDDQNGDAADPMTLIAVGPIVVTSVSAQHHAQGAVDASGNIHIVAESRNDANLSYYQFAPDGTEVVAETIFAPGNSSHDNPSIAMDSAGNAHIVWAGDNATGEDEVSYAMLDSGGNTLIAETLLTADDNERSKHATVNVDSQDRVHVVWSDARLNAGSGDDERSGAGDIFYMQIDPSLDDQSGDAASLAAIQVIADTQLTPGGAFAWYSWSTLGADGNLHVTWVEGGDCCGEDDSGKILRHMTVDTSGNVVSSPFQLSSVNDGETSNQYGPFATGGDSAFWTEPNVNILRVVGLRLVGTGMVDAATGTGGVTVSVDQGFLSDVTPLALTDLPADAQANVPTDAIFADGFFRIIVSGVPTGGTVNVTLDLPGAYVAGTDPYYKWDVNNGWQTFPYTNGASTNQVILALTDGGAGDADGVANGQIVDPGGPGAFAQTPDVVGMSQTDAEAAIVAAGLVVGTITTSSSGSVPSGDVISQTPAAATSVALGSTVDLEVSSGPATLPPPPGGGSSGGCSLGSADAPVDPTLPLLLMISLLYLTRRSWARSRLF